MKNLSVLFILTLVACVYQSVKVLFRGNEVFICVSHVLISYISVVFVNILVVFDKCLFFSCVFVFEHCVIQVFN